MPVKAGAAGTWNGIVKVEKDLWDQNIDVKCLIKSRIGNGKGTRFWVDCWVGDRPLMHVFPDLFVLESEKSVTVEDRLMGWVWKRNPVGSNEVNQLQQCEDLTRGTRLNNELVTWFWTESKDGSFSVADCRKILNRNAVPFYPFDWVKGIPKKISIFGWRAIQDRLPTLAGLSRRKILNGSVVCRICGEGDEDADHLFTGCCLAAAVWDKVSLWIGVAPIIAFTVKDLLEFHSSVNTSNEKRKLIRIIIIAACWAIWKTRNDLIFNGKRVNVINVFGTAQAMAFIWVKHKCNQTGWTWDNWVAFNGPTT